MTTMTHQVRLIKLATIVSVAAITLLGVHQAAVAEIATDRVNNSAATVGASLKLAPPPTQTAPQELNVDSKEVQSTNESSADDSQKFMLNSVDIEGITLLSEKSVEEVKAQYLNKEVSLNDLFELSNKLSELYREKGYLTSRVYLPPQKVEGGVVHLKAVEGRVGKIVIDEPSTTFWGFKERAITPRMEMEEGDFFNLDELRRSMIYLSDNPDLKVTAKLRPGANPGETDIGLAVQDQMPIHIGGSWDNLGRNLIGQQRGGVTLTHNNLLGFGDKLSMGVYLGRSAQSLVNQYSFPIGRKGTQIQLQHSFSNLKLKGDLESSNIQGNATTYTLGVLQPLYTTERLKVSADLAFDFKQLDTEFSKLDLFHDNLRILRAGINVDEYDRSGRTIIRNEVGIGLPLFGATEEGARFLTGATSSRANGTGANFVRINPSVTRIQRLPWKTYGIFKAIGQYSSNELVSAEQFQAGGAFTVRGYKEGRTIGDSGVLLSAEWRIPAYFLPADKMMPFSKNLSWRDAVTFLVFADGAATYTNNVSAGTDANEYLLGVGAGVRLQLTKFVSARLDLGVPLAHDGEKINGARLHFGLEGTLF